MTHNIERIITYAITAGSVLFAAGVYSVANQKMAHAQRVESDVTGELAQVKTSLLEYKAVVETHPLYDVKKVDALMKQGRTHACASFEVILPERVTYGY